MLMKLTPSNTNSRNLILARNSDFAESHVNPDHAMCPNGDSNPNTIETFSVYHVPCQMAENRSK